MLSVSMPAAVASLPLRCCRHVAAVTSPPPSLLPLPPPSPLSAVASWTPWLKSTPVLAAGARMGGSEINGGGCCCGCITRRMPSPHAAATRHCRHRRRAAAAILPPPPRCRRRRAADADALPPPGARSVVWCFFLLRHCLYAEKKLRTFWTFPTSEVFFLHISMQVV